MRIGDTLGSYRVLDKLGEGGMSAGGRGERAQRAEPPRVGVWRVDVEPGAKVRVGTPRQIATFPPSIVWMDAMPDRQRFLAIAPERTGPGSVTVVQNWLSSLTPER